MSLIFVCSVLFCLPALFAAIMWLSFRGSTPLTSASKAEFTTSASPVAQFSSPASPTSFQKPSTQANLDISPTDPFGGEIQILRGDWISAPGETGACAVICTEGEYVWCRPIRSSDGLLIGPARKHPKRSVLPIGYGVSWPKAS